MQVFLCQHFALAHLVWAAIEHHRLAEWVQGIHWSFGDADVDCSTQVSACAPWVLIKHAGAGALVCGGVNAGDSELQ